MRVGCIHLQLPDRVAEVARDHDAAVALEAHHAHRAPVDVPAMDHRARDPHVVAGGDRFRHNKKWWMTPIILVLLLLGVLVVLAGTGMAGPSIYTLF